MEFEFIRQAEDILAAARQLEKMLQKPFQIVNAHFGKQSQAAFLARRCSLFNILGLRLLYHRGIDAIDRLRNAVPFRNRGRRSSTLNSATMPPGSLSAMTIRSAT